jgi:hypothetical protein
MLHTWMTGQIIVEWFLKLIIKFKQIFKIYLKIKHSFW